MKQWFELLRGCLVLFSSTYSTVQEHGLTKGYLFLLEQERRSLAGEPVQIWKKNKLWYTTGHCKKVCVCIPVWVQETLSCLIEHSVKKRRAEFQTQWGLTMTISDTFVSCPVLLLSECLLDESNQGLKGEKYFTLGCLLSLDINYVPSTVNTTAVLGMTRAAILGIWRMLRSKLR